MYFLDDVLEIPQFSHPNTEEEEFIKDLTLSNVSPMNVERAFFKKFPETLVSVKQLKKCMHRVSAENTNGLDDINYFMHLVKGKNDSLVPCDVTFCNGMAAKTIISGGWSCAYQQDVHTCNITRMALFRQTGELFIYIYMKNI